ncbi:MAG: DUF1559 domain-containing protein [Planctomycetota bacterium]
MPLQLPRATRAILLLLGILTLAGCGYEGSMSKADLARYARSSSDDDDEDEDDGSIAAAAASKQAQAQPAAPAPPPPVAEANQAQAPNNEPSQNSPPTNLASNGNTPATATQAEAANPANPANAPANVVAPENPTTAQATAPSVVAIAGITPVDNRRPADPMAVPVKDRRKRSIDNIAKINMALHKWMTKGNQIPRSVMLDATRLPGLSWRVAILPELGYQDLYSKFNLKEPWDSPTNKELLKYIPPEFVSPERYDHYTNYQLFVNGTALFSTKETKHRTEISDAPIVLVMAEVDDPAAVPWTSPFDYDTTKKPLIRELGNLRSDGVFVGWMTGRPSIWPVKIDQGDFSKALTFEAGDRFQYNRYMEYPSATPGGDGPPTLGGSSSTVASANSSSGPNSPIASSNPAGSGGNAIGAALNRTVGNMFSRAPLPGRDELLAAEGKMRETYEDEFKRARTRVEFASLASTIKKQLFASQRRVPNGNLPAGVSSDDLDDGSLGGNGGAEAMMVSNLPPAELFVGLRSAFRLAIRGADANLSLELLNEISNRYEVSREEYESEMFDGLLGKGGSLRTDLNKASSLIPILENLILQNIADDDYQAGKKNLGFGLAAVKHINDVETTYKWRVLRERVEEGKRKFPAVAKHIETLEANPDDPNANHAVGWYFCIVKENWSEGAAKLSKSRDRDLRALALLEIQPESGSNRHVVLGDGWWDYAMKNKDETLEYEASMKRARYWYLSASANLTDGLDRIRANNRLDKIDKLIGRSSDPQEQALRGARRF